jgi:hypothetical protein
MFGIMPNYAKRIAYVLNTRPLAFLSVVFALRDALVGLALMFPSDYQRTVLVANLNQLGGAALYGSFLAALSLVTVLSVGYKYPKYTKYGLQLCAGFWMFAALSYALSGFWVFAAVNFLMCVVPESYVVFCQKFKVARFL